MTGHRRRATRIVVGLCAVLAIAMSPTGAHDGHGPYVDDDPSPYACGGAYNVLAWCEFDAGGAPVSLSVDYEARNADGTVNNATKLYLHGEIRVFVPETEFGFLITECQSFGAGTASCASGVGDLDLAADLPPTYRITCAIHAHYTDGEPSAADVGTFRCASGAR